MEAQYILLIVGGGVFALMLSIYCLIEFRKASIHFHEKEQLRKSYEGNNLKKMEYDVAFYDKSDFKLDFNSAGNEQVTIDELLDQGEDRSEENAQKAIFTHIEDDGVNVIIGNFRPTD